MASPSPSAGTTSAPQAQKVELGAELLKQKGWKMDDLASGNLT